MQSLVFWPLAGACGAGKVLPPCAQLLWCELYGMKDLQKGKKRVVNHSKFTRIPRGPHQPVSASVCKQKKKKGTS